MLGNLVHLHRDLINVQSWIFVTNLLYDLSKILLSFSTDFISLHLQWQRKKGKLVGALRSGPVTKQEDGGSERRPSSHVKQERLPENPGAPRFRQTYSTNYAGTYLCCPTYAERYRASQSNNGGHVLGTSCGSGSVLSAFCMYYLF